MDKAWEEASRRGDADAIRRLLARGVDVDARDGHGQTALMLAAHAGHQELVELLIAQRAGLDVTAKYGLSALMLAVVAGHPGIARQLAAAGADLALCGRGAPGFAGQTASDLAAARGMADLAAELRPAVCIPVAPATPSARCADYARFKAIDAAFRAGDLAALQAAVADPALLPNGPLSPAIGSPLEYAIYHSPLPFIARLLELGAAPNPVDHGGFPPLLAALSCCRSAPGAADATGTPARPDVPEILELLLAAGADPEQRGINDYTPLHMAVAEGATEAVRLLLEAGADPSLRTRIDACETPREMAEAAGRRDLAELLARYEALREK
ncbi:MAG TPA: ankyrin repeat domain-containing protein [Azospira sp.]|nr:ankyrin repeat domain-containing protein [Azospira sp.]